MLLRKDKKKDNPLAESMKAAFCFNAAECQNCLLVSVKQTRNEKTHKVLASFIVVECPKQKERRKERKKEGTKARTRATRSFIADGSVLEGKTTDVVSDQSDHPNRQVT